MIVNGKEVTTYPHTPAKVYFMVIIPAIFDLIGTALAKVGLMYTSVSVYQLIRSSVIIFCALFNIFLLKKTIRAYMWLGILAITISMALISASSLLGGPPKAATSTHDDPLFGILILLGSCVVASLQYVFEEKVMTDLSTPPLVLVGMEGVWGTVLMWGTVFPWAYILPGSDNGSLENVYDSWVMIQNSTEIQIVLFGFFVTVMLYNVCGILITKLGSSMWHTILDNFRPVSVWGMDLILFYAITHGVFGEAWTTMSYVQLAGMCILILGTLIYQGKVKIKGLSYEEVRTEDMMPVCTPQFGPSPMVSPSLRFTNNTLVYSNSPNLLPGGGLPTMSGHIGAHHTMDERPDGKEPLLYFVPDHAPSTADQSRSAESA